MSLLSADFHLDTLIHVYLKPSARIFQNKSYTIHSRHLIYIHISN